MGPEEDDNAAINSLLESMDIEGLSEKYCLSLKQSLFLAFLYLVIIVILILIALVALLDKVGNTKL